MKQAKAGPGTTIHYGEHVFEFGSDGLRQVTEAEILILDEYRHNGGPTKVEISEVKDSSPDRDANVPPSRQESKGGGDR